MPGRRRSRQRDSGISREQDLYTLDPDIAADEVVAGKYERYLAG
ncbi:hypothetical protein [Bradyrhizobium sp. AZCC 2289]